MWLCWRTHSLSNGGPKPSNSSKSILTELPFSCLNNILRTRMKHSQLTSSRRQQPWLAALLDESWFPSYHLVWFCVWDDNNTDNTLMVYLLLSSAYTKFRTFQVLTPTCQQGGWGAPNPSPVHQGKWIKSSETLSCPLGWATVASLCLNWLSVSALLHLIPFYGNLINIPCDWGGHTLQH